MKREETLSAYEFHKQFPDERTAVQWFEQVRWPGGKPHCPRCESDAISVVKNGKPQPYRCKDCRYHFSVKTGTLIHSSNLPMKKWLYAMYLTEVNKNGLSSLQLGHELAIAQEAAWRLGRNIREAWNQGALFPMGDPVETDETYNGAKGKHGHESMHQRFGRGGLSKQRGQSQQENSTRHYPRTCGAQHTNICGLKPAHAEECATTATNR